MFQKNEVGSSTGMEFEGFKRSMESVIASGAKVKTFVSDRHLSIAKYMKEKYPNITHYFDIWHLKKSKFGDVCSILPHT